MSSSINPKHRARLQQRSGNRCALPLCRVLLSTDKGEDPLPNNIGEAAHIAGERPGSARYDGTMTDIERNHYDNLIYVCANCHSTIDQDAATYTTAVLCDIKRKHESWIEDSLNQSMTLVTFHELDLVTRFLVRAEPSDTPGDLRAIGIDDKIARNSLSPETDKRIKLGLAQFSNVQGFILHQEKVLPDFGRRLRDPFQEQYLEMRSLGLAGDELYESLFSWASQGKADFPQLEA